MSVVYTFTDGTIISAAQVNANFALLANALNRGGGTMTGTLTSRDLVPNTTATYDLGTTSVRYRDAWLSRNLTVGGDLDLAGDLSVAGTFGLADTDASHALTLAAGSNLTADRILTFTTGDAARTITLSGSPTLDDWFNQSVKTTATPTFNGFTTSGTRSNVQVHSTFGGTVTDSGSATNMYGAWFGYTLSPEANDIAAGVVLAGNTINEAASGAHGLLAGMYLTPPTINAAAATVGNAATLYIGAAPSATVTGGNYALYIAAGAAHLGDQVTSSGTVRAAGAYYEYGRSVALGSAIPVAFNAGHYTTNSGTWTVASGDVLVNSYRRVGDTIYWNVAITASTTPGTNTEFRVTLPASLTVSEYAMASALTGSNNDPTPNAWVEGSAGNTYVRVKLYNGGTFGATTNTTAVVFQIVLTVL